MKNILILLLTVSTLVFAALSLAQREKLARHKNELVSVREELKTQEITQLQASQKLLEQQQQRESFEQASDLAAMLKRRQVTEAKVAVTEAKVAPATATDPGLPSEEQTPPKNKNGFGDFFSKLMEDPDTKKMIREQQRMVLEQLYVPLIKQLGLTPDEAEQFKDLLADNMLKGAEKATSLLGSGSSTNQAELLSTLSESQKNFDDQMKAFLGESRYAQYQDYQKTVGERSQLSQFRQQATGENAITDQQTEHLLVLMKEEKQNVSAATGFPPSGTTPEAGNLQAMLSGEGTEKLLQNQESVNQRVYDRAKDVLAENQLASFGKFQTNQLQLMRMGMNMARKFMTQENNAPALLPPPRPNP
jgi:hypothetical protein